MTKESTVKVKRFNAEKIKKEIISYFLLTFGTVLMAVGIYFFKFPNNFSTGGVSSMAIILSALAPKFTQAEYMLAINMLLLVVGLLVFGRGFAVKTVYCSVLLSVLTRVFEVIVPLSVPMTDQKLMELFFSIAFIAVGSAIIFNERASSGGTDIIAMILKKFTKMDIGKALLCSDFMFALVSVFIFDMETGMFSVFGLVLKAFVVDNIIDSINLKKCFMIVTDKPDEICEFINKELHRGATVSECMGAFTDSEKKLIITVLSRNQAIMLKMFIKETDKHAFSVITNSSDILGKGFRNVM